MKIKEGFSLRHVGNEHIVLATDVTDADAVPVFVLDDSDARLWQAIEGKDFTPETLVGKLSLWYDADAYTACKNAAKLVKRLKNCGLIVG